MDDYYNSEENNNEILASENKYINNKKNQNSSLDQNSTSANNTNGLQNKNLKFDEIPIKPATKNFLELLEKNLENLEANEDLENYYDDENSNRPKIKYEPRKKREIKFDFSKQKKYKYYAEKFDKNFAKDTEGFDNNNAHADNLNSKGGKVNLKYDKMKHPPSSSAARDAHRNAHNTKKDYSVNGNRNSNLNVNVNSGGNRNKGKFNFVYFLFVCFMIDLLIIFITFFIKQEIEFCCI